MKNIILLLLSAALLQACKKDSSSSKDILLAKIFVNGELETEYIYNSAKQVIEEKSYDDNLGAWALRYRSIYEYDASGNLLKTSLYKMPENKLNSRYVYTLNGDGKIARNSVWDMTGGGSGSLSTHIDHKYDGNGRLTVQTWRGEDEEATSTRNMTYYPNGNLRTSETYYLYGPAPEKVWGTGYGPSDTTMPISYSNIKAFPINFYWPYLLSSYVNHYTYDEGDVDGERTDFITARQYNDKGMVMQQTITTKHILPAGADVVRVMQYEYVEL